MSSEFQFFTKRLLCGIKNGHQMFAKFFKKFTYDNNDKLTKHLTSKI